MKRWKKSRMRVTCLWVLALLAITPAAYAEHATVYPDRAQSDVVWVPREGGSYEVQLHQAHPTFLEFETAPTSIIVSDRSLFELRPDGERIIIRPRRHVRAGTTGSIRVVTQGSMKLAIRLVVAKNPTETHLQRVFKLEPERPSSVAAKGKVGPAGGCSAARQPRISIAGLAFWIRTGGISPSP